jgi:hypothetical protein
LESEEEDSNSSEYENPVKEWSMEVAKAFKRMVFQVDPLDVRDCSNRVKIEQVLVAGDEPDDS